MTTGGIRGPSSGALYGLVFGVLAALTASLAFLIPGTALMFGPVALFVLVIAVAKFARRREPDWTATPEGITRQTLIGSRETMWSQVRDVVPGVGWQHRVLIVTERGTRARSLRIDPSGDDALREEFVAAAEASGVDLFGFPGRTDVGRASSIDSHSQRGDEMLLFVAPAPLLLAFVLGVASLLASITLAIQGSWTPAAATGAIAVAAGALALKWRRGWVRLDGAHLRRGSTEIQLDHVRSGGFDGSSDPPRIELVADSGSIEVPVGTLPIRVREFLDELVRRGMPPSAADEL